MLWISWMALAGASEGPDAAKEPEKVDVKALFTGPPTEGQRRCRSKKPDVAYITHGYTGGPVPYPGMVVSTSSLIIDRVEIDRTQVKAEQLSPPPKVKVQLIEQETLQQATQVGDTTRVREKVVLLRTEGGPVVGDEERLEVTWICETVMHPPRP